MIRDMTRGNITRHLVGFSVPIILGNLFQLAYNAVDSIVVGRFAGTGALAAVGTANPVMNIIILGVSGLCIGASVLMSEYFGARDTEKLRREFAATLFLGLFFSAAVLALGLPLAGPLLRLLNVPDEIFPQARAYLCIIFLGMPFTFVYNAYAAAMRSVGDSRTPIRFLALASVLNAGLDVAFVAGLHWGAVGAGIATVLAESLSAILCVIYTERNLAALRLTRAELRPDRMLMKLTLQQGSVTALQQACQPVGKLLIQGCVNGLGVEAIAVFNAVSRVDDFAFTPEQSISSGMMTFVSQNRGAKEYGRMRMGLSRGLMVETGYWMLLFCVVLPLRAPIMRLFVGADESAVALGASYLFLMAFFYLLPAYTNGLQGYFRGLGDMKITLAGTFTQISVRVVFVYLLVPRMGLTAVAWASLAGWLCMLLLEVPYLRSMRVRGRGMNGTGFLRQCAEKEAFNKLRQALLCLPYFLPFQPTETENKIPARPLRKDDAAKRSSKKIFSESLDLVTVARYIVVTGPVHTCPFRGTGGRGEKRHVYHRRIFQSGACFGTQPALL